MFEDEFDLFRARALTGGRLVTATYSMPVQQAYVEEGNQYQYGLHPRSQSERLPERTGMQVDYRNRTHTTAVCGRYNSGDDDDEDINGSRTPISGNRTSAPSMTTNQENMRQLTERQNSTELVLGSSFDNSYKDVKRSSLKTNADDSKQVISRYSTVPIEESSSIEYSLPTATIKPVRSMAPSKVARER